jgi:hypothetical protein
VDGRLDRPTFTTDELHCILHEDREEMDRIARSLGDDESVGGTPLVYTMDKDEDDEEEDSQQDETRTSTVRFTEAPTPQTRNVGPHAPRPIVHHMTSYPTPSTPTRPMVARTTLAKEDQTEDD